MFNAPRPAQPRYTSTTLGNSFVDENPLSSSTYDGLDPWSAAPTPPPPEIPTVFSNVLAGATVPAIYNQSFALVDSLATGETSVSALIRVVSASGLPATTCDRIVNLVSSRPRVSKLEFFIALALVALAQSGKDISIEQVAALAQQNSLPEPTLNLSSLTSSMSTGQSTIVAPKSPAPAYAETDPWTAALGRATNGASGSEGFSGAGPGAPSSITGGLGKDWWKRQENVTISILPEKQGFILNRYTVYQIQTDRGTPVSRRYSEFVYLWDCLVRRYPFRILPNLPPKRLGGESILLSFPMPIVLTKPYQADDFFLEQRRRGLIRFLNFVINHPTIKEDGLLTVFLTEPSFEAWRKHTSISLEEESVSKRIDRVEEMGIPSDLEDKLLIVRKRVPVLVEQWTRFCLIAERILRRREAASADLSRLTMTLNALLEENAECWRADDCELYQGVRQGLSVVSQRLQQHADISERRTRLLLITSLEAMKSQRDLYIAVRDLFNRHDRLSLDPVDKLRKRVETNSRKLEAVKAAQKDGWAGEADRILGSIEKDQVDITTYLARRVFVRHCMWHELRVVLHNRENALLTQAVKLFAKEERDFSEAVLANWTGLVEEVEAMPFE